VRTEERGKVKSGEREEERLGLAVGTGGTGLGTLRGAKKKNRKGDCTKSSFGNEDQKYRPVQKLEGGRVGRDQGGGKRSF